VIGVTGWPGLSLKGVCERAGLTERYFYQSFAGLSAFRTALLNLVAEETEAAIVEAINTPATTARETLRAVLDSVWRLLLDDPRRGRVAAMEGLDDLALQARRTTIEARFEHILTTRSAEVFELDPTDPATPVLAAYFVGAADEVFRRLLTGQLTTAPTRCSELLITVFTHGVPEALERQSSPPTR